ncbi:MAG: acetate/propionate family kinase [Opitutales bacterium]
MNILVANLGSTSFKYRLFRMEPADGEAVEIARGGFERVTDYGPAIDEALQALREAGHLAADATVDVVGFKTVLGRNLSGCVPADDACLAALDGFAAIAPAHNPPYAAGIRAFRKKMPDATLVALFETAFYQWVPEARQRYAVPEAWHEAGVRRYGFHGASHKFIAEASARTLGRDDIAGGVRRLYRDGPPSVDGPPLRVISCHLGGSSSVTGIRNGVAIGTSMGLSPQSGLPQNNRVGDLDSSAVPYIARELGLDLPEIERQLTKESGLLGVSGVSNDIRDVVEAAEAGNERAQLALDLLVDSLRHWIGAFFFEMGGADAIVFTAGIGVNQTWLRARALEGLESLGIHVDPDANQTLRDDGAFHAAGSQVQLLVIDTNEELVVAREAALLASA